MQFSRPHPSPGREFKGSAPGGSYCPSALPSTAQSKGGEIFGLREVDLGLLLLTQAGIAGTTKSNGPGRRCKGQQEAEEGRESLTPRGDGPDFVTPAEGSSRFYPMGRAPGLCWCSPTTHRRENASPPLPPPGRMGQEGEAGQSRTSLPTDERWEANREIKGGGGVERKRHFNKDKPQTKSPATQPLQQASSWETRTQRHHSVFLSSARG